MSFGFGNHCSTVLNYFPIFSMIYNYYLEIKNRFFILIFAWLSTSLVGYVYKEALLFLFIKPGLVNTFNSTISYFIYTNITDNYYSYFKLIFFISNRIFIFFLFFHTCLFLSSGLYKSERELLVFVLKFELSIILINIIFINNFLLPISLNFFLGFQSLNTYFEATLLGYLNFYIVLYDSFIINLQIFVLFAIFFKYLSIKDFTRIKSLRKFFYTLFFIFATIMTPPDIISQILVSTFSVIVYECLIFYYILKNKIKNYFTQVIR